MALRIRKNRKTIVCAAESKEKKGDIYINDELHYALVVEMKVLYTSNYGDTWYFKK